MNITTQDDIVGVITLKEITDMINVRHNDAMTKIEKLALEPDFGSLRETRIQYQSGKNTTLEMDTYLFTAEQAVAAGARLNNALLMKVIKRVKELEKQQQIPQTYSEALLLAAKQAEVIEKQNVALVHKTQTIKNVVHSGNTYTASQVAKDMENPISATLLNKMLRESGVIFKQNSVWQLYSKYVGHSLTSIKETKPDRDGKTYPSLRWTALGKSWIYKNWTEIKQRVATETLAEWELKITSNLPKVPMPKKEDRNF